MKVAIIMGSDSDLSIMKESIEILEEFAIPYEIKILSAHRTPNLLIDYIKKIEKKGIEVIIAGAGGAAHLPGVIAGHTILPVIGVPIKSILNGLDSLLSIVQMPSGVPVATVSINGAKNAALLAIQILSIKYPELKEKLKNYREKMKQSIIEKNQKLESLDYSKYLEKITS
ncbi:MAG: 5-(carboxyamino)imidazole ribonucleotide mutase [Thermodesulfobacteriota bacterium]|nr:MAG: 5-(carboxyamino)imidazole ribonucleotide mutase [Thermodesulfobacteriota bacterium]